MLIAGAMVFNYVITVENIPKTVSAILTATSLSPTGFLLLVNVILLVLGCFLEGTTIILVILPVLLPTAHGAGHRSGAFRRDGCDEHHVRTGHAAVSGCCCS